MTDASFDPLPLAARLPQRLARWASEICAAAGAYQLDEFTLAAICDRESEGGEALSPPGPTGTGDHGHGRGLMQIDDRAHPELIARTQPDGSPAWQDPGRNLMMGAQILREALTLLGEDYPAAICAYNAGIGTARRALEGLPPDVSTDARVAALDTFTTDHDYVEDVLARRDEFLSNTQWRPTV